MPTVQYTKKRSLASGSIGDAEILEFCVKEATPFDKPSTDELMTMGKAVASVFENVLQCWRVVTIPIPYSVSALAQWREFLHSVASRESFLWDPTGTEAEPGPDIYAVTMVSETWEFNRVSGTRMTVSMKFEETAAP